MRVSGRRPCCPRERSKRTAFLSKYKGMIRNQRRKPPVLFSYLLSNAKEAATVNYYPGMETRSVKNLKQKERKKRKGRKKHTLDLRGKKLKYTCEGSQ